MNVDKDSSPKPYEDLALIIRQTRGDRDISQRLLSDMINMSPGYVAQLESGRVQPSVEALRKLGAALNIPYGTLAFLARYTDRIDPDNSVDKSYYGELQSLGEFTDQEWNSILDFAGYIVRKRDRTP